MSCTEITEAIAWAKKTVGNDIFPVTAFFTRHQGVASNPNDPQDKSTDFCSYSVGNVKYYGPGSALGVVGHLAGELTLQYWNSTPGAAMAKSPTTVRVEVYPDGTVIFQDLLNGNLIPSPIKVTTTCVGGVVLTGAYDKGVMALGVRRDPEQKPIP